MGKSANVPARDHSQDLLGAEDFGVVPWNKERGSWTISRDTHEDPREEIVESDRHFFKDLGQTQPFFSR